MSVGLTLQVGERNFVKVDVLTKVHVREGETGDEAMARATQFSEMHLNRKAEEYLETMR